MTVTSYWFYLDGGYPINQALSCQCDDEWVYPVSGSLNSVVIVSTQMAVHVGV